MNRILTRFISFVICLVLIIGMLPVGSFAAEADSEQSIAENSTEMEPSENTTQNTDPASAPDGEGEDETGTNTEPPAEESSASEPESSTEATVEDFTKPSSESCTEVPTEFAEESPTEATEEDTTEAPVEETAPIVNELVYKDNSAEITVSTDSQTGFPENAELSVQPFTQEADTTAYNNRLAQAQNGLGENLQIAAFLLYDIGLTANDQEIEFSQSVSIKFSFVDEKGAPEDTPVSIIRFGEGEGTANILVTSNLDSESAVTVYGDLFAEYGIALLETVAENITEVPSEIPSEEPTEESIEEAAEEPTEDQAEVTEPFQYFDNIVAMQAAYSEDSGIPDDAQFVVSPVLDDSVYENRILAAQNAVFDTLTYGDIVPQMAAFQLYDLSFLLDSQEIQPSAPITITVRFQIADMATEGTPVSIFHYTDDGVQILDATPIDANGCTTFQADSFSEYGIALLADSSTTYETTKGHSVWYLPGVDGTYIQSHNPELIIKYYLEDGSYHEMRNAATTYHYVDDPSTPGYCLEPDQNCSYTQNGGDSQDTVTVGTTATETFGGLAWNQLSEDQQEAVGLVALYGVPNNFWDDSWGVTGSTSNTNFGYFCAGQIIIWEIVTGLRYPTFPYDYSNRSDATAMYDNFTGRTPVFDQCYADIIELMSTHNTIPSFACGTNADATANKITLRPDGTGYYTATVTDTNGILSKFDFTDSTGNVTFTKNDNTLTIKCKSLPSNTTFSSYKMVPSSDKSTFFLTYDVYDVDAQALLTVAEAENDPVFAYIALEIETGEVNVTKQTNTGKNLSGWSVYLFDSSNTQVGSYLIPSSGVLTISDLVPGTYYVQEAESTDPFWLCDTELKTVTVTAGGTASVSISNIHRGNAQLVKTTNTGENLGGWEIKLYSDAACTTLLDTYVTGSDGTVTTGYLEPGTYYAKETASADPFWSCDTAVKTVEISAGTTATVTFSNIHRGNAQLVKTTNTGENLSGWEIKLYSDAACTTLLDTYVTGSDGTVTTGYLEPGTYYAKETASADPFWSCDAEVKTVEITGGSTATVTFSNTHKGNAQLVKTTNTGENLDGWEIKVYSDAACSALVGTYITGIDGTVTTDYLNPGIYYARETASADPFWSCDSAVKTVEISAGATATVTFSNIHRGNATLVKATNTGDNLDGWEISLYSNAACTSLVGTYVTGSDGTVVTSYLAPGTYYAKETASADPFWSCDSSVKTVEIRAGATATVTFSNTHKGNAQLVKTTNTGKNLDGWEIKVYSDAACTTLVGAYVTGDDGSVTTGYLEPGTYYAKETASADPFWSCDSSVKTVEITAGSTATVTFSNTHRGNAKLVKTTNTGENLNGWEIKVYSDAACTTLVGTYVTSDDGTVTTDYLEPGTYYAKETASTDPRWFCDTEVKTVSIDAGATATVTFHNAYRTGNIQITKVTNTGKDLGGWTVNVYDADTSSLYGTYTFPDTGILLIEDLPLGTYYVQENTLAGDIYWVCDTERKTAEVTDNGTAEVTITNTHYGQLQLMKVMPDGGPLEGWEFKITSVASNTELAGSPFTTNENGLIEISDLLPGEYIIEEIIPEGSIYYAQTENPLTVTLESGKINEVSFTNVMQKFGHIEVTKITNTGKNLGGWDVTLYDANKQPLRTETIPDSGILVFEDLQPGTYYVSEAGIDDELWICDTEMKECVVLPGETTSAIIRNNHYGKISVQKLFSTEGPLEGWQFKVTVKETGEEIEGSPFTTDENGTFETGLLEEGEYVIEELFDEDALFIAKSENPITVTLVAGNILPVEVTNAPKPVTITIQKENPRGALLSGAEFILEWSEDGITWTPVLFSDTEDPVKGGCGSTELVNGCLTTDSSGTVTFWNLYPGLYYRITEAKAPNGYVLLKESLYTGQITSEMLELEYTVVNTAGYQFPAAGANDAKRFAGFGAFVTLFCLALAMLLAFAYYQPIFIGYIAKEIYTQERKDRKTMKNKRFAKMLSIMLVLCCMIGMAVPAFAAETYTSSVIDTSLKGSLTIYKYDMTNAAKDGVWDNSYVSTGIYDANVNNTLGGSNRYGDIDNVADLGTAANGTSNGYAIKGVEFTYLKVADITTYSQAEAGTAKTMVLYGIDVVAHEKLLTSIGLTADDCYAPATPQSGSIRYFTSDTLVNALRQALVNNTTTVKNNLEAFMADNHATATKMALTDENGKTQATNLDLGLYLVVETKVPEMVTNTTNPFFVSLPMTTVDGTNTTAATDGGTAWLYDVTLYPKNETGIPSLIKEVRESKDDTGKNDASSTITDGFSHNATGSAGDVMEYQIISTLPSITSDATALSAYWFYDVLDMGLTYTKGDVVIEFFKDADCTQKVATWTEKDNTNRFTVSYVPNQSSKNDATDVAMNITVTLDGLKEINSAESVYGVGGVRRGYSDLTMRVTYTAVIDSTNDVVFGDAGNENSVVLTWARTSSSYADTLVDDCHVYTYGIDLTKVFEGASASEDDALLPEVEFVLWNDTDKYWVKAEQNANETGVWYVTDHLGNEDGSSEHGGLTAEENALAAGATQFIPAADGKIIIKGLEDDTYILTEIRTANGYTLLKDHINIVISTEETESYCSVYTEDKIGLIQNDPRYKEGFANANIDGLTVLGLNNIPQEQLAHHFLTASSTIDGNSVTMLADDQDESSVNAFAPLTVVNTHGFDLPQTGETGAKWAPIIGAGVISIAAICLFAVILVWKRRQDEEEYA